MAVSLSVLSLEQQLHTTAEVIAEDGQHVYSADPDHIWNRLFRLFYVRIARNGHQYGGEELDPFLWPETEYLLSGPSHRDALKLLDEFLSGRAERLVTDPLHRAVFQRDLWAVFDWLADTSYKQQQTRWPLQTRVAEIIRRLALTEDQIWTLPDTYSDAVRSGAFPFAYNPDQPEVAFLPPDFFQPNGPWVCLGVEDGSPVAQMHVSFFSGRSVFLVFLQLPGGRVPTLAYLHELRHFPNPLVSGPEAGTSPESLILSPELPQFPSGTQVALVRQAVLVSKRGQLTRTQLTESVQIRVYGSNPERVSSSRLKGRFSQDVFEFRLSRARLFSGRSGGLKPVAAGEKEFVVFMSHPFDLLEVGIQGEILRGCFDCHNSPAVESFQSYSRSRFSSQGVVPSRLVESTPAEEASTDVEWKRGRYNWGLLEGLSRPSQ